MVLEFIDEKILKEEPSWQPYWGDPEPYNRSQFNDHILVFKAMEQLIEKTKKQIMDQEKMKENKKQSNKRKRKENNRSDME